MSEVNMEFRRAVTSTAFSVSLSKAQVDLLCAFAQGFDSTDHHSVIMTANALARKGMIAARPFCSVEPGYTRGACCVISYERYITTAGELMIGLLKEAGLFVKYRLQGSTFIPSQFNVGVRI